MPAIAIVLTVLTGLVGLVWLSRHLLISRENRESFVLRADYAGPPADAPFISVIVAAKDEEACIEECVRSMLTQDYPNFELLVCNDRSDDQTGPIVERIAAEDSRVKLVNITDLPEGWYGKCNAMQTGIKQARGDYICMIDADCRQTSTRTLSVAMQYAQEQKTDLLSVLPVLEMKGFWENSIQPVCGAVMVIWFRPDRVNNPNHSAAYANGAFMLIRRDAYEAIGTHEAVRQELNEDMRMADRIKKSGRILRVVRTDDLYMVRMYTSFKQILRGWSRIFFGTFGTFKRLSLSLLVVLLVSLLPHIATLLGLGMSLAEGANTWWRVLGITGAAVITLQFSVIFRYYKLTGAKRCLFWTYPFGALMGFLAILLAFRKLRRGAKVVWKNSACARTDDYDPNSPAASQA